MSIRTTVSSRYNEEGMYQSGQRFNLGIKRKGCVNRNNGLI